MYLNHPCKVSAEVLKVLIEFEDICVSPLLIVSVLFIIKPGHNISYKTACKPS